MTTQTLPNGQQLNVDDKGVITTLAGQQTKFKDAANGDYSIVPVDPVIANSPVRRGGTAPATSGTYDTEAAAYASGLDRTPVDPAAIRTQMRQNVQDQIDAIDNSYASLISKENVQGVDRLGRTRASNARSGTLGSDFGNAALDKTTAVNDANVKQLQEERDLKVQTILAGVNDRADAKVAADRATVDKNTQTYLDFLKGQKDQSLTDVSNLAKTGHSLDNLSDQEYNHILDQTGMSDQQLKDYYTLQTPSNTVLHSEVKGNQYIQVMQDPITKKVTTNTITLPYTVPADYGVEKLDNGTILFYNKANPSQTVVYGGNTPTDTKPVVIKFSPTQSNQLLGVGLDSVAIKAIQADVAKYGIDKVLEGINDQKQKDLLNKIFKAANSGSGS